MLVAGIVFNDNLSPEETHFISISISFGRVLPESYYVSGAPDTAQLENTLILIVQRPNSWTRKGQVSDEVPAKRVLN
jgi:hypothetical protein